MKIVLFGDSIKFGAEKYLYDGVHPTVAGAKLIADEWLKAFGSIVEKR